MTDPKLGTLTVCYWRPPQKEYPRWSGGWFPVPPERREEFKVAKKPGSKKKP